MCLCGKFRLSSVLIRVYLWLKITVPIFDQGYQHWNGTLTSHAWRWLAITRHGVRVGMLVIGIAGGGLISRRMLMRLGDSR